MLGSTLSTSLAWVSADLNVDVALAPATDYWVVVDCTGTPTETDGYGVGVETGLTYTRGNLKVYAGSWTARSPDADMPFILLGSHETTTQLEAMLASGQFVAGVDVRTASGIEECQYRDGTLTILDEVERLLEVGTVGEVGLVAKIGSGREAVVDVEPVESDTEWMLGVDGRLRNAVGGLAEEGLLPVGQWVRVEGVPSRVGLLADAARFFVERAEHDVVGGRLRLEPRTTTTS